MFFKMFRKILLISNLFFITFFANAQTQEFRQFRLAAGLGTFVSHYESVIENDELIYSNYVLPHLHFQLAYQKDAASRFSVLGQMNFLAKQTRFEISNYNSDGHLVRDGFYQVFWSGEMELAAGYDIRLKKMTIVPKLGGFVSWNIYGNTGMTYKITEIPNEALIRATSYGFSSSYRGNRNPLSAYGGLVVGCAFNKQTKKRNRTIGVFVDAYLPVQNFHQTPLEYRINDTDYTFQGRFRYLNVGFRYGLTRN